MNIRRLIFAAAILAAVVSCKKDEDTTALPTFDGYLRITGTKEYIGLGETLTLKPKGLTHPKGKEIGYYWKVSPSMSSYDTTRYTNGLDKNGNPSDGSFVHTFPDSADSLATYTIQCYAYADGYSGSSASSYTTIVKGGQGGSIKGVDFRNEITIGAQTWSGNNISDQSKGVAYSKADIMSDVFGRYYNYPDAVQVCNSLGEGWQLPTMSDWDELMAYIEGNIEADKNYSATVASALMGNATFNGVTMWTYRPAVGDINNASGFSAIPAGFATFGQNQDGSADYSNSIFEGKYQYAVFWVESGSDPQPSCKYLIWNQGEVQTYLTDSKLFGASVRCIRK